jgi:hypothetical protein
VCLGFGQKVLLNTFCLLIEVISEKKLAMVRKEGRTSTFGECSTPESCMLHSGKGRYIFNELANESFC